MAPRETAFGKEKKKEPKEISEKAHVQAMEDLIARKLEMYSPYSSAKRKENAVSAAGIIASIGKHELMAKPSAQKIAEASELSADLCNKLDKAAAKA